MDDLPLGRADTSRSGCVAAYVRGDPRVRLEYGHPDRNGPGLDSDGASGNRASGENDSPLHDGRYAVPQHHAAYNIGVLLPDYPPGCSGSCP